MLDSLRSSRVERGSSGIVDRSRFGVIVFPDGADEIVGVVTIGEGGEGVGGAGGADVNGVGNDERGRLFLNRDNFRERDGRQSLPSFSHCVSRGINVERLLLTKNVGSEREEGFGDE